MHLHLFLSLCCCNIQRLCWGGMIKKILFEMCVQVFVGELQSVQVQIAIPQVPTVFSWSRFLDPVCQMSDKVKEEISLWHTNHLQTHTYSILDIPAWCKLINKVTSHRLNFLDVVKKMCFIISVLTKNFSQQSWHTGHSSVHAAFTEYIVCKLMHTMLNQISLAPVPPWNFQPYAVSNIAGVRTTSCYSNYTTASTNETSGLKDPPAGSWSAGQWQRKRVVYKTSMVCGCCSNVIGSVNGNAFNILMHIWQHRPDEPISGTRQKHMPPNSLTLLLLSSL